MKRFGWDYGGMDEEDNGEYVKYSHVEAMLKVQERVTEEFQNELFEARDTIEELEEYKNKYFREHDCYLEAIKQAKYYKEEHEKVSQDLIEINRELLCVHCGGKIKEEHP